MISKSAKRCGIISIGVPWFDIVYSARKLAKTRSVLGGSFQVFGPDSVITDMESLDSAINELIQARIDALLLQVASFPDGEMPIYLAERLSVPIIVHSIPEPDLSKQVDLNSLCGANMICATLTAFNHAYRHIHGDPTNSASAAEITLLMNAAVAVTAIKQVRIGLIGFRAPGFYPCVFDEVQLRKKMGLPVDHIGLNELERELHTGKRRKAPRDTFPVITGGVLPESAVIRMEQYYYALTEVVRASGHSVFAIKDWPEFFDAEKVGAFWPVLGWIQQEDGILLAPEGDVNSAATMVIQRELAGSHPSLIDISAFDEAGSELVLWHYGSSEALARNQQEIRYCEFGREVQFTYKPGLATLAKIGLHKGSLRLVSIQVEIMDRPITIRRAGAFAKTLKTGAKDVIDQIMMEGWDHHLCLVHGDISKQLEAFAGFAQIPYRGI